MRTVYTIGIFCYYLAIWFASLFNSKAAQWINGRKHWRNQLKGKNLEGCIWMHCASLGEFEQGRPLLEKLRLQYPHRQILLTFFSPSGYEIRKDYPLAHLVVYLPLDTVANARQFLARSKPAIAIFVKYEIWHNFFAACNRYSVPLVMISAIFRKQQIYFKPWGAWFRSSLRLPYHIYTQDEISAVLLQKIGLKNFSVAGDTRFDRVLEIAKSVQPIVNLTSFTKRHKTIVAGSTWPQDEDILIKFIEKNSDVKLILAPHEIEDSHILNILKKFPSAIRWSKISGDSLRAQILIIDVIGLLSTAYQHGDLAYVGGGFGAGIHNTLEPAVYGVPVLFGPEYQKFKEAKELIIAGAAFSISDYDSFEKTALELLENDEQREKSGNAAANYVATNAGATQIIISDIAKVLG